MKVGISARQHACPHSTLLPVRPFPIPSLEAMHDLVRRSPEISIQLTTGECGFGCFQNLWEPRPIPFRPVQEALSAIVQFWHLAHVAHEHGRVQYAGQKAAALPQPLMAAIFPHGPQMMQRTEVAAP